MRAGLVLLAASLTLSACEYTPRWLNDDDDDEDGNGWDGWTEVPACLDVSDEELRDCSLGWEGAEDDPGPEREALTSFDGCGELIDSFRQMAIEQMRGQVIGSYCAALQQVGVPHTIDGDGDVDTDADGDWVDEGGGADEYSTTNNQEAGVDEADFVKNDGEHIYMVAGGEFLIIRAWPASLTERIASFPIEGRPRALFVADDRAFIYVYDMVDSCGEGWYPGCVSRTTSLRIMVLDISDRTRPELVREIDVSGSYVNSRRIGNAVHTVVRFAGVAVPNVRYAPADLDYCGYDDAAAIRRAFEQVLAENVRTIEAMTLADWLPAVQDHRVLPDGTWETRTDLLQSCDSFLRPDDPASRDMLSILSVDISDASGFGLTSIVGEDGFVYASLHNLYVARSGVEEATGANEQTTIHRFSLDSTGLPSSGYEATGSVPGRILNQFSMGEHDGLLRIATTVGHLPDPGAYNSVYVLEQQGTELAVIGAVEGFAATEDIRSARFVGDRGFVVTFKKTDPLFVLDLSDPRNPRIAGELEIPGFSTYIHMMDPTHLLTIGFDAQDEGDFAWFQGVALQVFDVSDMRNPALLHREVIGTRGTNSEATNNHLAFNYFAPRDALAIPMAICEGGGGGSDFGDTMTFNGLIVYNVTTESGFGELGRVSHGVPEDEPWQGYSCGTWWTDGASMVKRSIFMEDYVYSIADTEMIVAPLGALDRPIATIELPFVPDNGSDYGY